MPPAPAKPPAAPVNRQYRPSHRRLGRRTAADDTTLDRGQLSLGFEPKTRRRVEVVELRRVDGQAQGLAGTCGGLGIDARRERRAVGGDQRLLVARRLAYFGDVHGRRVDLEDHV